MARNKMTMADIREAVWDIICDETDGTFTMAFLAKRLPYGSRTRKAVCELCNAGYILRIGYGKYRVTS